MKAGYKDNGNMRTESLVLQSEASKSDGVLGDITGHVTGSIVDVKWGSNVFVG